MARPPRIDWPHTFYHVLSRGNERRPIFEDRKDYEKFLALLGLVPTRFSVRVWSYVLMGNHYHLLVRTEEANLSRAMQWLGTSYTSYFNWRWKRTGHLFQGRFKSFIIEEEAYLRQFILYLHRNPLRAKMVERLADYPWSSYGCLAYGRPSVPWLERAGVLRLFDGGEIEFRKQIQAYSEEKESLLENLHQGLFLGSEKLVKKIRGKLRGESERHEKASRKLGTSLPVREMMKELAETLEISEEEMDVLKRPIRGIERPNRDLLIYLIWRQGGHPLAVIGKEFQVGFTSIVNARKRGEAWLSKDKRLQRKLSQANIDV